MLPISTRQVLLARIMQWPRHPVTPSDEEFVQDAQPEQEQMTE